MSIPKQLKYTEAHEWVALDGKRVKVGMTDFAQNELGDIVFVELPEVGDEVKIGEPFGSVESVKTVSEVCSPLSGKVVEVNRALEDQPGTVNASPYDQGWMIVVEFNDEDELEKLWTAEKYKETYGG